MVRFLRSDTARHSRLGKNRRKLQKWRAPRGRHSKIRRKRFGYPRLPGIGFGTPRKEVGLIQGLKPKLVHNIRELEQLQKGAIAIMARIGARKKLEVLKRAAELKIKIANLGGTA
ncbi:50S ribosomal protein L32e [Candidatus Pacearchaeota archaeon]|nr:50S ribosomal protein L32e [Candidatus Pacearchaeota archaeon]